MHIMKKSKKKGEKKPSTNRKKQITRLITLVGLLYKVFKAIMDIL